MDTKYLRRFTTAPRAYDYNSYARESASPFAFYEAPNGTRQPVREVFLVEDMADIQINRYQSGNYPVWTPNELSHIHEYLTYTPRSE